jgi:exopolyphosphatase/guanosine-5'-triphosphate,3'-diphosphate pyrophosphatase
MRPVPLLRRKPAPVADIGRVGIIDIGSNSIRLVVYDGAARAPAILFNEKVMAGLGRGLARDGALDEDSMERAIVALGRFERLARRMEVKTLRTVATAAVRDASNGAAFLAELRALGLDPELLSGEDEARMAANGVLAAIPEADGIVGDLGGGSLELVRVRDGAVLERASFPFGVLRIAAYRAKGSGALDRAVSKMLRKTGWLDAGQGLPFYLVGGSWRALARLDMHLVDYPLPIVHHYHMPAEQAQRLVRVLAQLQRKRLREVVGLSASRAPTLGNAAALLAVLVRRLGSNGMVVSAYGLREGLLYDQLPPEVRAQDPLIVAAREEGRIHGRFAEHGDVLDRWLAPLFAHEAPADARLRHAACLLGDIGWRAHPEFRAERGLEIALHGNWVGIDARGRAMLARALYVSFGGTNVVPILSQLCSAEDSARADNWGLAIRLGQRLSGGVAGPLSTCRVSTDGTMLTLTMSEGDDALYGESVERRLKALAAAMDLRPQLVVG